LDLFAQEHTFSVFVSSFLERAKRLVNTGIKGRAHTNGQTSGGAALVGQIHGAQLAAVDKCFEG
jgi:hypothetical protein